MTSALFASALLAATAMGPTPPRATAIYIATAPKLDGRLDDLAWRRALPSGDLTQKFPDEGAAPSERTTIRVLYDDDALYIGVECAQSTPVAARLTRRGRRVESDFIEVNLGTRADGRSAFSFQVNAAGVLVDSIRFNDTDTEDDWDENWEARTHIDARGWTAELKIPLRILRFPATHVQTWDFQVRRYISARQETDEWAFIPRADAGEVSRYGKLEGLIGLEPRAPLELRPFVVGRVRRRDQATTQLASGTDVNGSAGVDLKWHPSQDLTLDASINPDFAQVEADQQVLNLTNFETYYPEKRPFFLEGIDMFTTPVQLVYTRRIGRAPPAPALRSDPGAVEQLVDVATPSTILGASKLTGRVSDHWAVGVLQAVTAENDVQVQRPDGSRVRRLADPGSGFGAIRIKRELEGNGHIGFLGTAVTRLESVDRYPVSPATSAGAMALCPNGVTVAPLTRCFNNAFVGGIDWRWRSSDGDWVTYGQAVMSTLQNGPSRVVRDGTVIAPGDVGKGIVGTIGKEGGKHWVGAINGEYNDRKLDVNDFGYDRRANNWRWRVDLEYRELEPWWELLESHARVEYFDRKNVDNLDLGSGYQANVSGKTRGFWQFFTELHYRPSYFDDREVGDGAALERRGRLGHELEVSTDPTQRVMFSLATQEQAVLHGGAFFTGDFGVTLRTLPQLDVQILPTVVYSSGEARYAGAGPIPGSYVFGRLLARSIGTTLRTTYTFTPRISLQLYAQLFLASGHYSDFGVYQSDPTGARPTVRLSDLSPFGGALGQNPDFQQGALNANVVLRWEYSLGSTVYLVYTRSQAPVVTLAAGEVAALSVGSVSRAPAADVVVVKLSHWLSL